MHCYLALFKAISAFRTQGHDSKHTLSCSVCPVIKVYSHVIIIPQYFYSFIVIQYATCTSVMLKFEADTLKLDNKGAGILCPAVKLWKRKQYFLVLRFLIFEGEAVTVVLGFFNNVNY